MTGRYIRGRWVEDGKRERCPTSHIEADGQLVPVFSQGITGWQIVTVEVFPGHHVVLDPCVLTCPTCHVYVARPYDPQLGYPSTDDGDPRELRLCGR